MYSEDEMLMLSGIQHFVFCPRQWALIHIEQQWAENLLTAEGRVFHENVDNPGYRQKNGDVITLRSVALASKELGLTGFSDAIELLHTDDDSNFIEHPRYPGHWMPLPVEYKRGKEKDDHCDEAQLTTQVLCLEEQYGITITQGALFYWKTRTRKYISIGDELRSFTKDCAKKMHEYMATGTVPDAEDLPRCWSCSLKDICMPDSGSNKRLNVYLNKNLYEETP